MPLPSPIQNLRRTYSRLSIRRQMLFAMCVPLLFAGLISVMVYQAIHIAEQTDQFAERSTEGVLLSQELLLNILNAQTGTRGFLITADEQYLRPYAVAVDDFGFAANRARQLWQESPEHLDLLDAVEADFMLYQREVSEPAIAQRRSSRQQNPASIVNQPIDELFISGDDKRMVDRMRADINRLITQERDALAAQLAVNERQRRIALLAGLTGPVAAVFIMVLLVLRQQRQVSMGLQRLSSAAVQIEQGKLDARIEEQQDSKEVTALAQAFNSMSRKLERRNRQTVLFDRFSRTLQSCRKSEEAYEVAASYLPRILGDTSGAIGLYRASRDLIEPEASWGQEEQSLKSISHFEPDHCWALRSGYPYHFTPGGDNLPCQHLPDQENHETLCIPMNSDEHPLGVLIMQARVGDSLSPSLSGLAGLLAETVAMSIANLRLRESLRNQSIRDPLTDLFNRRFMDETMRREIARVHRTGQALSLIVLDADHFKRFNDNWGHDAGDAVLVSLGRLLQSHIRQVDVPCRLGGEEFAVILPDCDLEQAMAIAEKLRSGVESIDLRHNGKALERVTVSLGVATCPLHASDSAELIKAADTALYAAKSAGRNRAVSATLPGPVPQA